METMIEQMQAWIDMVDRLCEQWQMPRNIAIDTAIELFKHNLTTEMEAKDKEANRQFSLELARMFYGG